MTSQENKNRIRQLKRKIKTLEQKVIDPELSIWDKTAIMDEVQNCVRQVVMWETFLAGEKKKEKLFKH